MFVTYLSYLKGYRLKKHSLLRYPKFPWAAFTDAGDQPVLHIADRKVNGYRKEVTSSGR